MTFVLFHFLLLPKTGLYNIGAKLPSSTGFRRSYATMGANVIPTMDTMGSENIQAWKQNYSKVNQH